MTTLSVSMDHINAQHLEKQTPQIATGSDCTCHSDPAAKLPFGDVVLPPAR